MTDVRANRLGALGADGILRYQWTPRADGQDDVEDTATRLWRAREEASWEALRLRLETSFAATETERTRQGRPVLGCQKARKQGLRAALEGEPPRSPCDCTGCGRGCACARQAAAGSGWPGPPSRAIRGPGPSGSKPSSASARYSSVALCERHECHLARTAFEAQRAYRADMDR